MPHKLSLVVPGLCGPLPGFDGMETAAAPLLELLKSLRKESAEGAGYAGLLAELFGLKIEKCRVRSHAKRVASMLILC